ncbi:L-rhamnose mutarotase [Agriterribacter sp.]|uniref:L-rhamnose mutarotase n=1 Tax=Agriterribacter sp. TaxID=2821509 RepID=UPI002C1EF34F|nr:L-rhamnose mutarotase [Agriterribacter sp.]HRP56747.1 L-rhamnose mutarotase [Agriterribacter sp.]
MKRYCLALDLKDDPVVVAEYKKIHQDIWPDIRERIKSDGITGMDIYLTGNRLFMIMEVNDDFSFERKSASDAGNPRVQEWENFMWTFQRALPWAKPGEKWVIMEKIFELQ